MDETMKVEAEMVKGGLQGMALEKALFLLHAAQEKYNAAYKQSQETLARGEEAITRVNEARRSFDYAVADHSYEVRRMEAAFKELLDASHVVEDLGGALPEGILTAPLNEPSSR